MVLITMKLTPNIFGEAFLFIQLRKFSSIRVLISLAANLDWPLFQLDVKNSFLHGDIYMKKFIWSNHMVLLLRESIMVVSVS
jgi:hypothetical protein